MNLPEGWNKDDPKTWRLEWELEGGFGIEVCPSEKHPGSVYIGYWEGDQYFDRERAWVHPPLTLFGFTFGDSLAQRTVDKLGKVLANLRNIAEERRLLKEHELDEMEKVLDAMFWASKCKP